MICTAARRGRGAEREKEPRGCCDTDGQSKVALHPPIEPRFFRCPRGLFQTCLLTLRTFSLDARSNFFFFLHVFNTFFAWFFDQLYMSLQLWWVLRLLMFSCKLAFVLIFFNSIVKFPFMDWLARSYLFMLHGCRKINRHLCNLRKTLICLK